MLAAQGEAALRGFPGRLVEAQSIGLGRCLAEIAFERYIAFIGQNRYFRTAGIAIMDYPLRLADPLRAHLRALRKQQGLTQAQLGQRLGIGQVRIAEIEAKPGLVSVDQLIKLLSALGATLILRDLRDEAASTVGARPATARKTTTPASRKTRAKTPTSLHIPPKKGSW
ncbi:MAG TPA: helix-turn-helix domain-containing protein [Burkholderiaceae bacterium]|nr:helix-turn-helix domain-containing protein [Burkholderiaceae bacterium]